MFLTTLNKNEKEEFLSLAVAVIKADGIVDEAEKELLNAYATEMQVNLNDIAIQDDVENVITSVANNSTEATKRTVFIELLALAFADGDYAAEEKEIVQKVAQGFGLKPDFVERAVNLQDAYTAVCSSLVNLVKEGV